MRGDSTVLELFPGSVDDSQPFVEHVVDAPGMDGDGHDEISLEMSEFPLATPHLGELALHVSPDGAQRAKVGVDGGRVSGPGLGHGDLLDELVCKMARATSGPSDEATPPQCPATVTAPAAPPFRHLSARRTPHA
jgi:hypothetical protein